LFKTCLTKEKHRTISLNSHYIVVFKNPSDSSQIIHLAIQAYPSRPKIAQQAFADATSDPYGCLLFDFKQSTPEKFCLRSKIFPDEKCDVCSYLVVIMSVRLQNQTPMLGVLCKSSPKAARDIIETADNDLIKCICE